MNNGNTCYRNAVLQGLLSLPPFTSLLLLLLEAFPTMEKVPPSLSGWREVMVLANAMRRRSGDVLQHPANISELMPSLCMRYHRVMAARRGDPAPVPASAPSNGQGPPSAASANSSSTTTSTSSAAPSGNTKTAGGDGKGIQEDAMEFLDFLLDTLHEELAGGESEEEVLQAAQESLAQAEGSWNTIGAGGSKGAVDDKSRLAAAKTTSSSSIHRLFFSTLRKEVTYAKTKKVSVTFEPNSHLQLSLEGPDGGGGGGSSSFNLGKRGAAPTTDLNAAVEVFFRSELLDNKNRLKNSFDSLPPALLLQFKRFTFDYKNRRAVKLLNAVRYPLRLVLRAKVCSDDLLSRLRDRKHSALTAADAAGHGANSVEGTLFETQGQQAEEAPAQEYDLAAVILHHGQSAAEGHYTSYAKGSDGVWRHFDDVKVSVVEAAVVTSAAKEAYLLFYLRL